MEAPVVEIFSKCEALHISDDDPQMLYFGMSRVGVGSFGSVYCAVKSDTMEVVAIKQIEIDSPKSKLAIPEIKRELEVLSGIEHINCVSLINIHLEEELVWIVMEFCIGSVKNLVDLMGTLTEPQIASILNSCLQGLDYIHEKGIIHRDIKADNILISQGGVIKIADFGSASLVPTASTFVGTPFWMAPEVILAMDHGQYTTQVDVWSMGITAYELGEKHPPLFHLNAMSALYHITQNEAPQLNNEKWSLNYRNFTNLMLNKDPLVRPTAKETLKNPFLDKIDFCDVLSSLITTCADKARIINRDSKGDQEDLPESEREISENTAIDEEFDLVGEFGMLSLNKAASKMTQQISEAKVRTLRTDETIIEEFKRRQDGGYINLKAYQELRKSNHKKLSAFEQKLLHDITVLQKEHQKALALLTTMNQKAVRFLEEKQNSELDRLKRAFRNEIRKSLHSSNKPRDIKNFLNKVVNFRQASLRLPSSNKEKNRSSPSLSLGRLEFSPSGFESEHISITAESEPVIRENFKKMCESSNSMISERYSLIISQRESICKFELTHSKLLVQKELQNLERLYQKKEFFLIKLHEFETNYQKDHAKNKLNELKKQHVNSWRDRLKDHKSVDSKFSKQYKSVFKTVRDDYYAKLKSMLEFHPKEDHPTIKTKLEGEKQEAIKAKQKEMENQIEAYMQENVKITEQQAQERADLENHLDQESKSLASYQQSQLKQLLQTKMDELQALHSKYTALEMTIKNTCDFDIADLNETKEREIAENTDAYESSLQSTLFAYKSRSQDISSSHSSLSPKDEDSSGSSSKSSSFTKKSNQPGIF